jgi:RNA polymerase sigma-70 factor (ECF subfamily)
VTTQLNEADLIRQARAGDTQAFGALVLAHQRFAYNLALRGLGDPGEAEDITQEAFLRAWLGLPQFKANAQFRTWLYRIVVNLCYNRRPRLRRELADLPVDEDWDLPASTGGDLSIKMDADEQRAFLHRQIEQLPDGYRMLVMLRYQEELAYEEIAAVLGMPLGTVKTGLFRAKAMLRSALAEQVDPVDDEVCLEVTA